MNRKIFLSAALLSCSACAHIDHGQVDYRIAEEASEKNTKGQVLGALERRYLHSPTAESPFKLDEVYSINLEQVVIGEQLLEGMFLGHEYGEQAEIAILANVFEFSGPGDSNPRGFDYGPLFRTGEEAADTGSENTALKLIYFSEDIERGQAFNLSNIPIVPRTKYSGGSIGIRIVVLELDTGEGPVSSLMQSLASEGRNFANDYSPRASQILFDLGESLLSSGQSDDVLLDYMFTLNAAESTLGSDPVFTPGRYVIRRQQNRRTPMDWSRLRLDHNTGRVVGTGGDELRNELILTVNMNKYPAGTALETFNIEGWDSFRRTYQEEAINDPGSLDIDNIVEEFRDVLLTGQSESMSSQILGHWRAAERALTRYERLAISQADLEQLSGNQCIFDARQLGGRRDIERSDVRESIRDLLSAIRAAKQVEVPGTADEAGTISQTRPFANVEEEVVNTISRYFMPWTVTTNDAGTDISTEADFVSFSAFETAFLGQGKELELFNRSTAIAEQRSAQRFPESTLTCQALVRERLLPSSAIPTAGSD